MTNPLKKYRTNNNLTQTQLAELLGVSGAYISQIEAGKRLAYRYALLFRDRLGIPVEDTFAWADENRSLYDRTPK